MRARAPIVWLADMPADFHNREPWHKIAGLRDAGHPVLFVDQIGAANPRARNLGKLSRMLARRLRRRPLGADRGGDDTPQLQLVLAPPRHHRLTDALNVRLLRRQIGSRAAALGFHRPIIWYRFPSPELVALAGTLGESRVVYECVDLYTAFGYPPRAARALRDAEQRLLERADLTIVTSDGLRAHVADRARRVELVRHGSDVERFARAYPVPSDLRDLPRPLFGYTGPVDERLDTELVAAVARANPGASVVIVGPVTSTGDSDSLRSIPNCHLLGQRASETMPAYVGALDVALLPYRLNPQTTVGFPVKVLEYLAAARRCVAIAMPEAQRLVPAVTTAETAEEFVAAVAAALGPEAPETVAARRRIVEESRWPVRIAELTALIDTLGDER